jgi:serine/threonine protein kinase
MQFDGDDRFEIRGQIGSGSFGVVYEAFDHRRNRPVAIKMLERASPDTLARFKREFRSLAELRHPNLASLYELVVVDEHWLLTMELIRGSDLLEHLAMSELQHCFLDEWETPTIRIRDAQLLDALRSGTAKATLSSIYLAHVRDCFRQLALAIATLHSHGVIHRDIKPSNIMITPEGRVALLDFGLVIPIELDDSVDRRTVAGTPGYMSPEQIQGSPATPATDWYSFGVLLYQALTGTLPFSGSNALEIVESQLRGDQISPAAAVPGISDDLDSLCRDLLRPDPSMRPDAQQILARLGVHAFGTRTDERTRSRSPLFIGRSKETKALMREFHAAQRGKVRVVLLNGSPGSGKSTLADHFLDTLRGAGAFLLGGRCHPWESVPLNAVDTMVDSLARSLRRERPPAVDEALSRCVAVSRLFPALSMEAGVQFADETIELPPSGEKLIARATSELRTILAAAAGDRPMAMMLDDAQWGDFESARVFAQLLDELGDRGALLILVYRTEDWRTSLFLQYLRGVTASRELHVDEFGSRVAMRVIESLLPRVPKRAASRINRESGGNPALIEMIVGHGRSDSPLADAIAARLERVSAPARALFELLLVADAPLEERVAADALELFETDEPLRSLTGERLVRVRRTGDLHEIDVYHPRMRLATPLLLTVAGSDELRRRLQHVRASMSHLPSASSA